MALYKEPAPIRSRVACRCSCRCRFCSVCTGRLFRTSRISPAQTWAWIGSAISTAAHEFPSRCSRAVAVPTRLLVARTVRRVDVFQRAFIESGDGRTAGADAKNHGARFAGDDRVHRPLLAVGVDPVLADIQRAFNGTTVLYVTTYSRGRSMPRRRRTGGNGPRSYRECRRDCPAGRHGFAGSGAVAPPNAVAPMKED